MYLGDLYPFVITVTKETSKVKQTLHFDIRKSRLHNAEIPTAKPENFLAMTERSRRGDKTEAPFLASSSRSGQTGT